MATLPVKSRFTDQTVTEDQFKAAMNDLIDYLTAYSPFPSGTRLLFQQSSAPTGWTKEVSSTYDNAAMRIVTGGVTTGGADVFTTTFGTAKSTAGYALQVADIPSHSHTLNDPGHQHTTQQVFNAGGISGGFIVSGANAFKGDDTQFSDSVVSNITVNYAGGGGAHSHTLNSMNLKYVDTIVASKD